MTQAIPVKKFKRAVIPLEGVHCASCVTRLENGLNSLPGVAGVSVNLPSRTAFLSYDPAFADAKIISGRIEELGYKALAFSESAGAAENTALRELEREKNMFLRRFLLGLLLTCFLLLDLVFGFSPYTMLAVAGLAWGFAGWHFHAGFLRALKARTADMNSLVSLSTSVTYFYGVFVTLFPGDGGHYHAQWHEVGMLVTFINLGRWLEARSKNKAGEAVARLFKITPKFARRFKDGREQTVPVAEIVPGDLVLLRPGEQVPVDGRVAGGASALDESLLTGEAVPVEKEAGARVYAGTINKTGALEFTAEGVGEDTVLMKIIKAVEESQAEKSAVQHMVDRISAWFVPLVFLIATVAAGLWFHHYDLARAAGIFAAVLAVACPCAMGLAVPMAVAVGFGRAASAGILIRNADVLERASGVDVVIFDKTGTITEGRLHLAGLHPEKGEKDFLQLLASAEEKSEHPFAEAVRLRAKKAKVKPLPLTAFEAVPGKGVRARAAKGEILVGSLKWFDELGLALPPAARGEIKASPDSMLLVALDGRFKGYAGLADALRPEAAGLIRELEEMGIEPVMASGDRQAVVAHAAAAIGIKTFHAEVFPEEKRRLVMRYKALGKRTAMVGDGFNDAPALSEADLGMAMRSGTDVAVQSSDITLMNNDLRSVITAVKISKAIKKVINQNLAWAFAYNIVLIPMAAGVLYPHWGVVIPPSAAGAAMALSSVSVVMNSLRLKRTEI
ncbi:MAG: copper-translocating P-type ATPase [Elusimicrobia bacterium]|nr:copper-translocating P-type ATPase [Elusimicrobiota bacterium]